MSASIPVPDALFLPSSPQQQSLRMQHRLLHLLHHRNRNQHRRSPWYRHFSDFRRQLKALCADLDVELGDGFAHSRTAKPSRTTRKIHAPVRSVPAPAPPAQTENAKLTAKAKNPARAARPTYPAPPTQQQQQQQQQQRGAAERKAAAARRLEAWVSRGLIERWYTAFASLTATPSSSPLALALLGVLARVCSDTGATARLASAAAAAEEQGVRHAASEGEGEVDEDSVGSGLYAGEAELAGSSRGFVDTDLPEAPTDDVGVAVSRDQIAPPDDDGAAAEAAARTKHGKEERKRKRRKKGNTIDDLFASLS